MAGDLENNNNTSQESESAKISELPALNLSDLKKKNVTELYNLVNELGIDIQPGLRKQELIFAILKEYMKKDGQVYGEGVLEVLQDGF
ncbi:Rho termination factor N-terminal domain-containing protein, partial [Dissulfuribacter thermophilus]|uniref:Rho termination factor N-terminal domain-containing protein n=1 Tax=Dissulfuribacter thermophilus TaxID=1156395 RepID=UPI000AB1CF92